MLQGGFATCGVTPLLRHAAANVGVPANVGLIDLILVGTDANEGYRLTEVQAFTFRAEIHFLLCVLAMASAHLCTAHKFSRVRITRGHAVKPGKETGSPAQSRC